MNMFHRTATIALLVLLSVPLLAVEKVIPLYEGPAPGSEGKDYPERDTFNDALQTRFISNVVKPTLTVLQPAKEQAVGTAVIICPGGGFHALAIDVEGHDVARSLTAKGITCFILKYRLVETKTEDPFAEMFAHIADFDAYVAPTFKLATADGLAAVDYVRKHADEYGIEPDRIGIIGFSAGGMVSAAVAFNYSPDTRPDFVASIYPGWKKTDAHKVPSDAPPLFVLAATDDQFGLAPDSVALYQEWAAARKPAELHLYAKGGHGFGMRQQDLPSDHWIDRYTDWLGGLGVLAKP
jgi:acetyl esterase/lipase